MAGTGARWAGGLPHFKPIITNRCGGVALSALRRRRAERTQDVGLCCRFKPPVHTGWRTKLFAQTVQNFLQREGAGMDNYMEELQQPENPFKGHSRTQTRPV
jgi:hypothetical protein